MSLNNERYMNRPTLFDSKTINLFVIRSLLA